MYQLMNMVEQADSVGIDIEFKNLSSEDIPAVTIEIGEEYTIVVNGRYKDTFQRLKCVLAHELGHCLTGATHTLSSSLDTISRHEYRANKWAIEALLPLFKIQQAAMLGCTEIWQLAEWFHVEEDFMRLAIWYYREAKGINI